MLNGRWKSWNVSSQCRTSVYTSITSYPTALLQERDVNFDGVNAHGGDTRVPGKILSYSPIAGTIARADCTPPFPHRQHYYQSGLYKDT